MKRYLLLVLFASIAFMTQLDAQQPIGIIVGGTPIIGGSTGQCLTRGVSGTVAAASCGGGGGVNSGTAGQVAWYAATGTTVSGSTVYGQNGIGAMINGGTVTGSTPALAVTQTWNNALVAFTGMSIDITPTAQLANSKLLDVKLGGASQWSFERDNGGNVSLMSAGTAGQGTGIQWGNDDSSESYYNGNGWFWRLHGSNYLQMFMNDNTPAIGFTASNNTWLAYAGTAGSVEMNKGTLGTLTGTRFGVETVHHNCVALASLASPVAGDEACISDGFAALAWGVTAVAGGSTNYGVRYNGAAWTVTGK